MYTNWQIYVDMHWQQICKISCKKRLIRSENIPKSFRVDTFFLKHRVDSWRHKSSSPLVTRRRKRYDPTFISFDSIPACDDRQTDGRTRRSSLLRTCSRYSTDARQERYSAIEGALRWLPYVNPLMGTLKPQSNGPLTAIQRLVHRPLMGGMFMLRLVQRGGHWAGCGPAQLPPDFTKCNSPPTNGQCTNFILFDVAL